MKEIECRTKIAHKSISSFRLIVLLIFSIAISIRPMVLAQEKNTISEKEQSELLKIVCEKLEQLYPFPEVGKETSESILKNLNEGKYLKYTDPRMFALNVTRDLENISQDKHLDLLYNPEMAAQMIKQDKEEGVISLAALEAEAERWNNYGFKELKILDGNIGYMALSIFFSTKYAGKTAVATMNYFSNCNALIIDLRKNRGGWDDMVTLLSSYFFETEDNVIFGISRSTLDDSYYASMTSLYVPGKKLSDIPLFILTSQSTFSAAEAFAHIMKHLNDKATLVGEKTGGAENPVEHLAINDQFVLRIPCWRKIYAFTDSRWEGEGVEPDIEVDADKALQVAHLEALKTLQKETTDDATKMKYQWVFDGLNAKNNPVSVDRNILQSYTGGYRDRIISYENGELYYKWGKRPKSRMIPISDCYFILENYDYFRIRFKKEEGKVVSLEEIFANGRIINNKKIENQQ